MGNWNRRYFPRRKRYRQYDYEDPDPSYDNYFDVSDVGNSNVPQWEIDYCKSVRVPWHKVLAAKKYSHVHPNVREWDDSAGEEALKNAKQRYWATINGLPYEDNPLPDPNMFVDEIDWNTYIDPELMEELDRVLYDPDHEQNVQKLATKEEEVVLTQVHGIKNGPNDCNLWETNQAQSNGALEDAIDGWGWRVDSQNLKNNNPWEQSCNQISSSWNDSAWESNRVQANGVLEGKVDGWGWSADSQNPKTNHRWEQNFDQPVDSRNDSAWESGNNSRDRNQTTEYPSSYTGVNPRYGNPCNISRYTVSVKRGWGHGDREDNSRNWNQKNTHGQELGLNVNNVKDRVWKGNDNTYWGPRESVYQGKKHNYLDSRQHKRGGRSTSRGGFRNRESSMYYTTKDRSSRPWQVDNYGDRSHF